MNSLRKKSIVFAKQSRVIKALKFVGVLPKETAKKLTIFPNQLQEKALRLANGTSRKHKISKLIELKKEEICK